MRASSIFFLAAQLSAVWALPAPAPATNALSADAAKAGEAKAPGGAAEGEKKEEEKKNEKDVPGQFGVAVALEAGATKQDVKYPAGVRTHPVTRTWSLWCSPERLSILKSIINTCRKTVSSRSSSKTTHRAALSW